MTDRTSSNRPALRLVSLFVLLGIVPLALLTYFTIHLAERAVVREVNARVGTTATVTAALLRQQMQGVADLAASYASRPILVNALADGDPAAFDSDAINRQLAQLQGAQPGNGGVFLADASCRLTNAEPATPAIVGVDFSFRDWCKGVNATGRPYVSEAYRTAIAGNPLVVAAAAPVRATGSDDPGRRLGTLAVVYTLDAIRQFADDLARAQGVQLTITDQGGTVLVGRPANTDAGALTTATFDPRVREALAGGAGVTRSTSADGDALSALAPVEAIGWTVTAEVPARQALAGVGQLRWTVLSVAGLLGLVMSAGMVVLARTLRLRREAERAESDLAAARDQALESSRLKSEFLANMSHEVRTPLNGVLGMTSLLLDTELDADQRHFAETVSTSGEALLGILNDILDFSKIEAGRLDVESIDFDLRAVVEDTVGLLSVGAHQKGLELACSLPADVPAVRGDPGRLRQVLTNLVSNAVKFTAAGEVLLEMTVEGGDDATAVVRFNVVDTGIGIAPADHAAIFESFSQADVSSTRRYGGTGLGLAISRQLVELMGGHLGVDSELGQGSTFWFTLPLEKSQPSSPTPKSGGPRLLVPGASPASPGRMLSRSERNGS